MKDLLRGEFIGKSVKILASKASGNLTISGNVVDETKYTLSIMTKTGIKRLMKKGNQFAFIIDGKTVQINGELLEGRSEDRIKIRKGK